MKSFIKKKAGPKLGYRTPKDFRGKVFAGKKNLSRAKFNRSTFRIQHKG